MLPVSDNDSSLCEGSRPALGVCTPEAREQVAASKPDAPFRSLEAAENLRQLGRLEEAQASLEALLACEPRSLPAWAGLARIARSRGMPEQALAHYQQALALQPVHPTLSLNAAEVLRELGRLDEAQACLEALLARKPGCASAWAQLGYIALFRGDSQAALTCFEAGMAVDPGHAACYIALVDECIRLCRFEQAQETLEQGRRRLGPGPALELRALYCLMAQGQREEACRLARELWSGQPGTFEVGVRLVQLLIGQADFDEAAQEIEVLARVAQSPERQAQIAEWRARLARARFDLDGAMAQLRLAVTLNPHNALLHEQLARVCLMQGHSLAATEPLDTVSALLGAHAAQSMRAGAEGGLLRQMWREFRTDPAAEARLRTAGALPLAQQSEALSLIQEDAPDHAGAAIAWLIALKRNGSLDTLAPAGPDEDACIPRQILQFWDADPAPQDIRQAMQTWPRACAGYGHQVFDDARAQDFIARECDPAVLQAFHRARHPAMRADLLRLAYLAMHGGLYADADDLCRHDLSDWLQPGCTMLLLQEDVGSIGNNFIAAVPRHPFILHALERITANILDRPGDCIWFVSGPGALSVIFCQFYGAVLRAGRMPAGVAVKDVYHMQQRISMHLPRAYKQDERYWLLPKAAARPLARPAERQ